MENLWKLGLDQVSKGWLDGIPIAPDSLSRAQRPVVATPSRPHASMGGHSGSSLGSLSGQLIADEQRAVKTAFAPAKAKCRLWPSAGQSAATLRFVRACFALGLA